METASELRKLVFSGAPRDIGRAYGEELRAEIHAFYALRLRSAQAHVERETGAAASERSLLQLAEDCLRLVSRAFPEGYAELLGISEGADMPLSRVWLMNALTDIKDLAAAGADPQAEGCSSVVLTREAEGRAPIAAQTWDLDPSNQPFVVLVERRPERGLPSVALTTAGCLSLTGINAAGVAVGTNNIRAKDSRPGVGYLDVLHHMLGQRRASDAAQIAEGATRAAAHAYFTLDPCEAWTIECTATRAVCAQLDRRPAVYTNHIQDPELQKLELMGDPGSTYVRAARLTELAQAELDAEGLKAAMADHAGGEQAICRHGARGVRTNGAVVLEPEARQLHAVSGPPCGGGWITAQLSA